MTLFRRNNDVVIALCVRLDRTTLPLRPRLHYIKHTVHWLYCSGCWFHLGSAYLHIYFWSLLFSSNNLKILWHHCQCKVDLTVVNNASICVIRQLSVETTFVLIQLKLNPMYTNEQASNLSPTILTVLDGPYRRLSVFVRGCWGLFSCIVHTVMDFAMKYIFLVSNH